MSQIDVIKENVQYEQLLRESTGSNILKGEYLIKDSHPDVHEILGVDAKATVTNKEVLADKVMLEGVVTYTVLYLSIDESDIERINSVNLSEKFADYLELTGIEHKVLCDVECVVEHIQANIMNERKISVEGVRTTKWNIYQIDEFEFIKDLEGTSDIQVQKEKEAEMDADAATDDEALEAELFDSDQNAYLKDEDFAELRHMEEEEAEIDDEQLLELVKDGVFD